MGEAAFFTLLTNRKRALFGIQFLLLHEVAGGEFDLFFLLNRPLNRLGAEAHTLGIKKVVFVVGIALFNYGDGDIVER